MHNVSMVIGGVVVATGLTSLHQLIAGKLSMQPVISGFVVGTALLITAFFSTGIASAIALLLLVASVMNNGVPILALIANYANGSNTGD